MAEAETPPDIGNAKVEHDMKDDELCNKIIEVLGRDGPQRVLLAGEAGIGKTRLAKMVGERVIHLRRCFLTLCAHLNQKFDDERSLYENIASQLSVYSDFEETEVDDRDEDEEDVKKEEDLLVDLKNKISEEIEKKEKVLADKIKLELAERAKKAGKNEKEAGKKNTAEGKEKMEQSEKNQVDGEKKDTSSAGPPYLLLILDDGRNKTSEEDERKGLKLEEYKTSEEYVMKDLKLEEFLKTQKFLKDPYGRLKILVTKRKGDEETSKDTKSEQQGDEETSKPGEEV